MPKSQRFIFLSSIVVCLALKPCFGAGETAALSLLEPSGARAASLAQAFSAVTNDVTGLNYNPASLNSIRKTQATFLYENGIEDESFGQLSGAVPLNRGSIGASIGLFDGGNFELSDGNTVNTVSVQQDLLLTVGYAVDLRNVDVGASVKYISSELIEREKATAFAIDLGAQYQAHEKVRVGGAVQNFGTELKYVSEGEDLPRIIRAGVAYVPITVPVATTIFFDLPYLLVDSEIQPALGVEGTWNLLSGRLGYKKLDGASEFSLGTGFNLGQFSLDYAFGMVSEFNDQHRLSFSMEFGEEKQ